MLFVRRVAVEVAAGAVAAGDQTLLLHQVLLEVFDGELLAGVMQHRVVSRGDQNPRPVFTVPASISLLDAVKFGGHGPLHPRTVLRQSFEIGRHELSVPPQSPLLILLNVQQRTLDLVRAVLVDGLQVIRHKLALWVGTVVYAVGLSLQLGFEVPGDERFVGVLLHEMLLESGYRQRHVAAVVTHQQHVHIVHVHRVTLHQLVVF